MRGFLFCVAILAPSMAESVGPQCRERSRQLVGEIYANTYVNYEIPIDMRSQRTNTFPDICLDVAVRQRMLWPNAGLFEFGDFMTTFCAPNCAHFVTFANFVCGVRLPPMKWVQFTDDTKSATNCDEINLPIQNSSFAQRTVLSVDLCSENFAESSLNILVKYPWKGILLQNCYTTKKAMKSLIETLLTIPTLEELYILSVTKWLAMDFDFAFPLLGQHPWKIISIEGVPFPSSANNFTVTSLKALRLMETSLTKVPEWLSEATNLQYLMIDNADIAVKNIDIIKDFPKLEHLILARNGIESVPETMLSTMPKLISLDLSCNLISKIPVSFFKSTPDLRFLSLAGNRLTALTSDILASLTKLRHLDLSRTYYPYSIATSDSTLYYFSRLGPMKCRANFDAAEAPLTDFSPEYLPAPDQLQGLELVRQSDLAANLTENWFSRLTGLSALNVQAFGLSTFKGLGLEQLKNLSMIRAGGNSLTVDDWLPTEIVTNLHKLQHFFLGNSQLTSISPSILALARSSPQIGPEFAYDIDATSKTNFDPCHLSTVYYALRGATLNESCVDVADELIEKSNEIMLTKMQLQASMYPADFRKA